MRHGAIIEYFKADFDKNLKVFETIYFLDLEKDDFRCADRNKIVEIDDSVFNKV